jgi:hypothetical protein
MIDISNLIDVDGQPLLLNVNTQGLKTLDWAKKNKNNINEVIQENGAVLIRGLNVSGSKVFSELLKEFFSSELISYTYRSTPRTCFKGNIYTATEYPSTEFIDQHNENSYSKTWPNRIGFFCMIPAQEGGETPIADSRKIYRKIPVWIRDKFERKGLTYIRNYSDVDLPWEEVFQTTDRQQVEVYCKENNIDFEWLSSGNLRTKQTNSASIEHPKTCEKVWFNQAHIFHISNLGPEVARSMKNSFGIDQLPRHVLYGDGTEIDEDDLNVIRVIYRECQIKFHWKSGDVLLLDNLLFTHGREPFKGIRKVLVGMSK